MRITLPCNAMAPPSSPEIDEDMVELDMITTL